MSAGSSGAVADRAVVRPMRLTPFRARAEESRRADARAAGVRSLVRLPEHAHCGGIEIVDKFGSPAVDRGNLAWKQPGRERLNQPGVRRRDIKDRKVHRVEGRSHPARRARRARVQRFVFVTIR